MEMFLEGNDPSSFRCAQEPSRAKRRIRHGVAFDCIGKRLCKKNLRVEETNIPLLASPPRSASAAARSLKRRRGGCVTNKISRSHRSRRSRGGFPFALIRKTTPASLSSGCFAISYQSSATPPCSDARRGMRLLQPFVHSRRPPHTAPSYPQRRS